MLSAADVSLQQVLRYFTKRGLDVGLLVPTETGMAKGIMDATGNVRDFLRKVASMTTKPSRRALITSGGSRRAW